MEQDPDRAALERDVVRLGAELEAERAYFRAELAAGADELARRDELVVRLRRQRNRARRELAGLRSSRLVRLAARLARRRGSS